MGSQRVRHKWVTNRHAHTHTHTHSTTLEHLASLPVNTPQQGNHDADFHLHRSVLLVSEFNITGISLSSFLIGFFHSVLSMYSVSMGLPWWVRWKRIHLPCRRPRFNPWVGKNPRRRERQPTPVFLPWEFHGQRSLAGYSWGRRVRHDWATNNITIIFYYGI